MTTIKVHQPYAEVLQWLQDNVGPLLHSQPIIFWHGEGWHLNVLGTDIAPQRNVGRYYCNVEFDREDAVIFALRW